MGWAVARSSLMADVTDPCFRPSRRNPPPRLYDGVVGYLDRLGLGRPRGDLLRGLDGDVLELGVGFGRQLPHHPAGAVVIGVDLDAPALRLAKRPSPGTRLLVADAEALPFGDASFDWIVSALVLCTDPDPDPDLALREVRRVLRPGRRLRVLEHVRSPHWLVERAQGLANPLWGVVAGGCQLSGPTEELMASSGFALVGRRAHLGGHMIVLEAEAPA